MVRHATAKKRRSGTTVKRKPQKNINLRIQEKLSEEIRAVYDKKKSVKENLANMGLVADPNNMTKSEELAKKDSAFLGFISRSESMEKKSKKVKLSDLDVNYMKTCIEKYGEDYHAMERDIKVNYMQHTAKQLEKLYKRCKSQLTSAEDK